MNRYFQYVILFASVTLLFLASACNDLTDLGADQVSGEELNLVFQEENDFVGEVVVGNAVRVFEENGGSLSRFYFGDLQEPITGTTRSELFFRVIPSFDLPRFGGATLDSAFLVLDYDSAGFYGITDQAFELEVDLVDQSIPNTIEYFSDASIVTTGDPIAQMTFVPNPTDSVVVADLGGEPGATIRRRPHLRIPLNSAFAQQLFTADSINFTNDSLFFDFLPGLHVYPTSTNDGLLAFALSSGTNGLELYYTEDTVSTAYRFSVVSSSTRFPLFQHDYTNSLAQNTLDSVGMPTEYLFVQGLAGLNIDFDLATLLDIENVVINRAEFTFTEALLNPEEYLPLTQLLASTLDATGNATIVEDVNTALNRTGQLAGLFGGNLVYNIDSTEATYTCLLTSYVQDLVDGGLASSKLRISAFNKPNTPNYSVLKGNKSAERPQLKVYYTRFQ